MPPKGYKSVTIKQTVYDYFFNEYSKIKEEYAVKKGIRSFSAYVSYRLSQILELTVPADIPRFEHFNIDDEGVRILDRALATATSPKGRIIDIYFKPNGIFCDLDQKDNCEHINFALTVPEIQDVIRKKRKEGWKLPDV